MAKGKLTKFMFFPSNMLPWACFPIPPLLSISPCHLPPDIHHHVETFSRVSYKNLWIVWVPEWEQKQFLYLKDTRKPFRFCRSTVQIKPFLCSMLKARSSWNIDDGWKWRRRSPLLFFFFFMVLLPQLLCVTNRSLLGSSGSVRKRTVCRRAVYTSGAKINLMMMLKFTFLILYLSAPIPL